MLRRVAFSPSFAGIDGFHFREREVRRLNVAPAASLFASISVAAESLGAPNSDAVLAFLWSLYMRVLQMRKGRDSLPYSMASAKSANSNESDQRVRRIGIWSDVRASNCRSYFEPSISRCTCAHYRGASRSLIVCGLLILKGAFGAPFSPLLL
jgi:hypothetical protein